MLYTRSKERKNVYFTKFTNYKCNLLYFFSMKNYFGFLYYYIYAFIVLVNNF